MTTADAPALSVIALGARHVPESHDPDATGRLDYAGGLLAAVTIVNPRRTPRPAGTPAPEECMYCGLEAPPLMTSLSRTPDT